MCRSNKLGEVPLATHIKNAAWKVLEHILIVAVLHHAVGPLRHTPYLQEVIRLLGL